MDTTAVRQRTARPGRRGFLIGAGGLTLLGAAGCGGAGSTDSGGGGKARTIKHKYGSTEVPGTPTRVVTVGLTEQDYVLALGVAPVGVREWFGEHPGALWPWAREALGDDPLPEVLPVEELNFEQIASLETDLILGVNSGLTKKEYETLSEIAPTIAQAPGHADFGAPWQDIAAIVGTALNVRKKADTLVRDIEKLFDDARAEHPEFGGATALLASSITGEAWAYAEGPAPGFLTQLGFDLPEKAEKLFTGKDRAPVQVSTERLDALEADVLLVGVYGPENESITSKPVFKELDASKEGRVLTMPEMSEVNGALSFGSLLSLPVALDAMLPRIAALADGDPDTKADKADKAA
ncbi:iron complex transport system substrate-binding protein [Murinocardiopsis flavida]|uniref:Iron complex transport system substrate-binding protein n=1 Tax=Murinocardiopsis flavida TaxID=645275 RepID=A0A2P8DEP2_9ACTN|nr:iron-siderophore ABC transporter substrate-binding protein [Murinocardiopsis flavida]PSK95696.1 iron complex transport system substrate-binding protein [Murinocardiopsis flavida]